MASSKNKSLNKATGKTRKNSRRSAKKSVTLTAANADKHVLYQDSVQDPEFEIEFVERVFKQERKAVPLSLREDFCGTSLLASSWVASHPDRVATGIDLDKQVLQWGREHNQKKLGEAAARLSLINGDVLEPRTGKFDAIVGYNYSYFTFQTRELLQKYFRNCAKGLKEDGLLFLDAYGGPDAQHDLVESRNKGKYTYVWEQSSFNPIDNAVTNYIHFKFRDGSKLQKAFTYHWRLWQLIDIRELLQAAGFKSVDVYWEGADEDGEGDGKFEKRTVADNDDAWNAYIVAGLK